MNYPAVKIIIVIEKLICRKICDMIESYGVKAYTLVPAGGKGHHHNHPTESQASIVDDFTNIKIEAIVKDKEIALQTCQKIIDTYLKNFPGIIYTENVNILRPEKFDV